MDIPVVRVGLVLTGCDCAADRGKSCGGRPYALQRQVPAVQEFELKMPLIQFILSLPDIPVVLQRRSDPTGANCAENRKCSGKWSRCSVVVQRQVLGEQSLQTVVMAHGGNVRLAKVFDVPVE